MVVVISAKREKHGVLRGEAGVGEDNRRGGGWVERGEGLLLCEEVRWSGEERGGAGDPRSGDTPWTCVFFIFSFFLFTSSSSVFVRPPPREGEALSVGLRSARDIVELEIASSRI